MSVFTRSGAGKLVGAIAVGAVSALLLAGCAGGLHESATRHKRCRGRRILLHGFLRMDASTSRRCSLRNDAITLNHMPRFIK